MDSKKNELQERMESTLKIFIKDMEGLRAGRAKPSIIEGILIPDSYGGHNKLNSLASISTQDHKTLIVKPWEPKKTSDISKELSKCSINFSSISEEAGSIRLILPELTQEARKNLIKLAHNLAENIRNSIRNIRRDILKKIKNIKPPEDELRKFDNDVQKITDDYEKKISQILKDKEKDLSTI